MSIHLHPLPPESLPPGWVPTSEGDVHIAYCHQKTSLTLLATLTSADRCHPALGLASCWEIRLRIPAEDQTIEEQIARVSNQQAAIEGLLRCMDRIGREGAEGEYASLLETLNRVSFHDLVPDHDGADWVW